jgi:hypothetical protein
LWDWNCQSGSRSNPYPSGKAGHTRSCQLNLGGEYTLWDR